MGDVIYRPAVSATSSRRQVRVPKLAKRLMIAAAIVFVPGLIHAAVAHPVPHHPRPAVVQVAHMHPHGAESHAAAISAPVKASGKGVPHLAAGGLLYHLRPHLFRGWFWHRGYNRRY